MVIRRIWLAPLILGIVGCDPAGESPAGTSTESAEASVPVAADFDFSNVRPVEEHLADPRYAEADLDNGELLTNACRACHTLGPGQKHGIGPNLHGFFGQPAARHADFEYSEALKASGIVWTPAALEAWLALPTRFLPGTIMPFAGFKGESDRRDLVAYLLRATTTVN